MPGSAPRGSAQEGNRRADERAPHGPGTWTRWHAPVPLDSVNDRRFGGACARDELTSGEAIDRHVVRGLGREGLVVPTPVAALEGEAGDAGHQVELGWPDVAMGTPED